jgi:DNA polymerase-3 subunit chi
MAEIRFYHLTKSRLEDALIRLLRRVIDRKDRVVVMTGSGERTEALNALLWSYDPASFLPHGSAATATPRNSRFTSRQPWKTRTVRSC